jgi:hypothetical protein
MNIGMYCWTVKLTIILNCHIQFGIQLRFQKKSGGQHGVNSIAVTVCKMIAAHAVLGLEMTDH